MTNYQYNTSAKYNQLGTVKYNSTQLLVEIQQVYAYIGPRPVVLDQDYNALAVLDNSFDVYLDQEVNGMDELSFSIPFSDPKRPYLQNENIIQMFDTLYIIRKIDKLKGSDSPTLEVYCEALWYDLAYEEPLSVTSWTDMDPSSMLTNMLDGTGWTLGTVEITSKQSLSITDDTANRLTAIWDVQSLWGADVKWDTTNKKLNFLNPNTTHSGVAIQYAKNMKDLDVYYDTRDLITKLYVYGKDNLTLEAANNGKKYVEDYSYTTKVRVRTIQDDRFDNPFTLLDFANAQLAVLCKPQGTYKLNVLELSRQTGMSHEKFSIGDILRIYDKELELDSNVRIMKWKYDVIEPWNTEIQLEQKIMGISDLLATGSSTGGTFTSGNTVDKAEMLDLMVFNYLLNSRADDGFSYWANTGWSVDAANGYSGNASFRADGVLGQYYSMKQTVYPSHRDTYALSFRAYVENYQKGANSRVGINVTVTYDDNTTEEIFVSLI